MSSSATSGIQVLDRAMHILRLLGEAGDTGLRLIDIQKTTGLSRPTAHRILSALGCHGFAAHEAETRRYHLGTELAILGWSISERNADLRQVCADSLSALAADTGDTAFLMVRSGEDAVCAEIRHGAYPVRTMTADVGTRRPLGVGASGVSILAALDAEEAERLLISTRGRLAQYPHAKESAIRRALQFARTKGYAVSSLVLPSVRGLAVPILRDGEPVASFCVASIRERIPSSRIPAIVRILQRERAAVESRLLKLGGRRLDKR